MYDCIRVAMEKVIDQQLPLDFRKDGRGYQPTEIAIALLSLGYAMTMYEKELEVIIPPDPIRTMEDTLRKKFIRWRKKMNQKGAHVRCDLVVVQHTDLEPTGDCMVEVPNHAIAYVDGEYWDGDNKIDKPSVILSYWVPTRIKSD